MVQAGAKKIGLTCSPWSSSLFWRFLAFQVIPGDRAIDPCWAPRPPPERIAALRAEMGLDRPFLERYVQWVLGALKGDFGTSYGSGIPVSSMLAGEAQVTGLLTGMSLCSSWPFPSPWAFSPPATPEGSWTGP